MRFLRRRWFVALAVLLAVGIPGVWLLARDTSGSAAKLCWQLGVTLVCSTYARDAASGDITLYRAAGSAVEQRLRRASNR